LPRPPVAPHGSGAGHFWRPPGLRPQSPGRGSDVRPELTSIPHAAIWRPSSNSEGRGFDVGSMRLSPFDQERRLDAAAHDLAEDRSCHSLRVRGTMRERRPELLEDQVNRRIDTHTARLARARFCMWFSSGSSLLGLGPLAAGLMAPAAGFRALAAGYPHHTGPPAAGYPSASPVMLAVNRRLTLPAARLDEFGISDTRSLWSARLTVRSPSSSSLPSRPFDIQNKPNRASSGSRFSTGRWHRCHHLLGIGESVVEDDCLDPARPKRTELADGLSASGNRRSWVWAISLRCAARSIGAAVIALRSQ